MKKNIIQAPMGETTVLLHTCCAPCSSAIIEVLMQNGITPIIYYCNPNIYPREEYEIRKNECTRYAQALGLEIVDADYDHENWLTEMKGLENEPERGGRCLKCFKLRLLRTALYARDGLAVVALAWIVMSLFGALPFFLSGEIPNFMDAVFETVSGFTGKYTALRPLSDALNQIHHNYEQLKQRSTEIAATVTRRRQLTAEAEKQKHATMGAVV